MRRLLARLMRPGPPPRRPWPQMEVGLGPSVAAWVLRTVAAVAAAGVVLLTVSGLAGLVFGAALGVWVWFGPAWAGYLAYLAAGAALLLRPEAWLGATVVETGVMLTVLVLAQVAVLCAGAADGLPARGRVEAAVLRARLPAAGCAVAVSAGALLLAFAFRGQAEPVVATIGVLALAVGVWWAVRLMNPSQEG